MCDRQGGSASPRAPAEAPAVLVPLPPEQVCLVAEAAVPTVGSRWPARTGGGAEEAPGEVPGDSEAGGGDGGGAGDDGGVPGARVAASLVGALVWSGMDLLAMDSAEGPVAMGSAGLSRSEGLATAQTRRGEARAGRDGGSGLWIHGSALRKRYATLGGRCRAGTEAT